MWQSGCHDDAPAPSVSVRCAFSPGSPGFLRRCARSPGSSDLGKVLIRGLDRRYLPGPGPTQRQPARPVAAYVRDHHNQRLRRLLPLHKQKRSCNTATCVTIRLADFLSRSGAMGSRSFIPTDVGAKAFGRKRRSVPM